MADRTKTRAGIWVLVALGAFWVAPGHAQTTGNQLEDEDDTADLRVGAETRVSDNIKRRKDGSESDIELFTYTQLDYRKDVQDRCRVSAAGTFGYRTWQDESYDSQFSTNGRFFGICRLAEGFNWRLEDQVNQLTRNSRLPDTPSNETRRNVFSTGPSYTYRLTALDSFTLRGNFQNTTYGNSEDPDSNRYSGSVSYQHIFSSTLSGGVSASHSLAEYDTDLDVTTDAVSLFANKSWVTTSIDGSVGTSRVTTTSDGSEASFDGWTAELGLTRRLSPDSRFRVSARRDLSDQTSFFTVLINGFEFDLEQSVVVEVTSLSAAYIKELSERETLNISFFADQTDYVSTGQDETNVSGSIDYSRPLAARLSLLLSGGLRYQTFAETTGEYVLGKVSATLSYEFARDFYLQGAIGQNRRVDSEAQGDYVENWISGALIYEIF